jgi:hypothetical protein
VPRWFAHLLVVVGWLLTPGLAWVASYAVLWCAARLALHAGPPLQMLGVVVLAAGVAGVGVVLVWVRFMRRVPHLLSHHMAPRPSEAHSIPTE